jgi:hypothetical protein
MTSLGKSSTEAFREVSLKKREGVNPFKKT